jgi:hypothetical protein
MSCEVGKPRSDDGFAGVCVGMSSSSMMCSAHFLLSFLRDFEVVDLPLPAVHRFDALGGSSSPSAPVSSLLSLSGMYTALPLRRS